MSIPKNDYKLLTGFLLTFISAIFIKHSELIFTYCLKHVLNITCHQNKEMRWIFPSYIYKTGDLQSEELSKAPSNHAVPTWIHRHSSDCVHVL